MVALTLCEQKKDLLVRVAVFAIIRIRAWPSACAWHVVRKGSPGHCRASQYRQGLGTTRRIRLAKFCGE